MFWMTLSAFYALNCVSDRAPGFAQFLNDPVEIRLGLINCLKGFDSDLIGEV